MNSHCHTVASVRRVFFRSVPAHKPATACSSGSVKASGPLLVMAAGPLMVHSSGYSGPEPTQALGLALTVQPPSTRQKMATLARHVIEC